MSQTGQQTVTRHILPNISRRKGNQTMKFSQLIEYNMRKVWWRSLVPKYFIKNQN